MNKETGERIAKTAVLLVDEYSSEGHHPRNLLPREDERVHAELKQFANSVVFREHTNDWGKGKFIKSNVARTQVPLFVAVDVRSIRGNHSLQGYGSWLYRNFPGSYAAVFDEQLIESAATSSQIRIHEAVTRLFLHELGHFVLHRDQLFNQTSSSGLAMTARAEMEAEAWFFAYVILGLARGDRAATASGIATDTTWLTWP